jgi:pimeloyl-ACP methyl ester carboxylesterase
MPRNTIRVQYGAWKALSLSFGYARETEDASAHTRRPRRNSRRPCEFLIVCRKLYGKHTNAGAMTILEPIHLEGHIAASAHEPREISNPGIWQRLLELRALWEHYAALALWPVWGVTPKGDGHPVMVLPGLAVGDASTALLRCFLCSRGFAAVGWGQGLNLGLRPGVLDCAHETLGRLRIEHGRAVSLVGWSLGGLYARELAKRSPEMVRLVITLGSPFTGHPRQTNAWRLYEFASGHRISEDDLPGSLRAAPPVPTTSIWSLTDGVVSWRCSVETQRDLAENIVVDSSHLGLAAHPAALYAIADRLAHPEGYWAPFHRRGWRGRIYSDPAKVRTGRVVEARSKRSLASGCDRMRLS